MGIIDRTGCPDDYEDEMSLKSALDGPDNAERVSEADIRREYTGAAIQHATYATNTRWISGSLATVALALILAVTYTCHATNAHMCEQAGASWMPVSTPDGSSYQMSCVTKDAVPLLSQRIKAQEQAAIETAKANAPAAASPATAGDKEEQAVGTPLATKIPATRGVAVSQDKDGKVSITIP